MSATAREIMTEQATCIPEHDSISEVARQMASLQVGSMPICGDDDRLKGMITDRDIVVKVLAEGRNPDSVEAGELGQGKPVTIGADDPIEEAISTMEEHCVRRLPVIDGHRLVGIISQGDIATSAPESQTGALVESISAAP